MTRIFALLAFALLLLGGAPQPPLKVEPPPAPSPRVEAPPSPGEGTFTLFFMPHPEGDLGEITKVLQADPRLRVTFVFPPRYFELSSHRDWIDEFSALQSSGQIEIGLTLDNEPNLPLLGNLALAGPEAEAWGVNFAWPDDIAAQIAKGSGIYQKRWGAQPSGMFPPHFALSNQVMDALRRFRLHWALAKPRREGGVKYYGNTALFIPWSAAMSSPEDESPAAVDRIALEAVQHPFSFVDASRWKDPQTEVAFLKKFSNVFSETGDGAGMATAWESAEALDRDSYAGAEDPLATDFSAWARTTSQRLAWLALAEARRVAEAYKNSGRASLPRLDAALDEIHTAESGTFLLALGQTAVPLTLNERNFLATLSNVYRLSSVPIPPNLPRFFSDRGHQRMTAKNPSAGGKPFFMEGAQKLLWNDAAGDDKGDGGYVYPVGRYPKGAFDLSQFSVTWNDTDVTFSVSCVELPDLASVALLPLADVYIDVNRLPGAGSVAPLQGRGPVLIDREAAWEYVVTFTPRTGAVYQPVPGSAPRRLRAAQPSVASRTFAVTVPRSLLRGDPNEWRLSLGLLGAPNTAKDTEFQAAPILPSASENGFGGAPPGRTAPPFVDLLAPTAADQTLRLGSYRNGEKATLPYVGAE